jgi:hypothetical protein
MSVHSERRLSPRAAVEVFSLVAGIGDRLTDLEDVVPEVLVDDVEKLRAAHRILDDVVERCERLHCLTASD